MNEIEMEHLSACRISQLRRSRPSWPGHGTSLWLRLDDGRWRRVYVEASVRYVKQGDKRLVIDQACEARIAHLRIQDPASWEIKRNV